MTELELDRVYTDLCRSLGDADDARLVPALCRFALLAMIEIDDATRIQALIARAAAA